VGDRSPTTSSEEERVCDEADEDEDEEDEEDDNEAEERYLEWKRMKEQQATRGWQTERPVTNPSATSLAVLRRNSVTG
jgi:hypothetical protein